MNLTPLGTVRRRLGAPEPRSAPYPTWLVSAARERDLGEEAVYLAWELARCVSGRTPKEHEALLTLIAASIAALREGSTRLDVTKISDIFSSFGADEEHHALAEKILEGTNEILGRPGDYKPLILDGEYLYHQRVHRQERELSDRLEKRLDAKAGFREYTKILDALDRVLAHRAVVRGKAVRLTAEQQHAIRTALTRSLTVISGGPGTGKTSIVVSILRMLARLDVPLERVALAAPTGKAAKRVAESIQSGLGAVPEPKIIDAGILEGLPRPMTLHRLLGYSPRTGRFRYDERNPLPLQVLIVDEASMIDLDLMDRLLRAVRPETRLVLLGDADQLPSVEAGAVFRDLVKAGGVRATVELQTSYRMDLKDPAGRNLYLVSRHIRDVKAEALVSPDSKPDESVTLRARASEVELSGVELLEEDEEAFLERWFRERVMTPSFKELAEREHLDEKTLGTIFAHIGSHAVLCVTNHDAERVNAMFRRLDPARFGEPVMVLRNDYERGLFNGDQGVVLKTGVVFPSGASYDPAVLERHLAPAYAMTVHKSQGSELDHVALILPEAEHPLLTRELLYTAMTRARKSVTVVGQKEAFITGIGRSVARSSGISEKLA